MSDYYDRFGTPIDLEEWMLLLGLEDYRTIAKTDIGGGIVSTVWLGLNHSWDDGPLRIFETMVFVTGSPLDGSDWRYATEDDARAGHEAVVELVRDALVDST